MKVLIADDDAVARKFLTLTLEHFQHEPVVASGGAEAWEILETQPEIRVVVSDWMMPEVDGIALCSKVRERKNSPYVYFIMLTAAYTASEDYTFAMDSGVDDFLTKPVDREMLRTRLRVAERILRYSNEINQLQDLIPICAYCSKIRDEADFWQGVDTYLKARTGTRFSHGICPDCLAKETAELTNTETEPLQIDINPDR